MKALSLRDVLILVLVVNGWAFNVIAMKFGLMELPPLFMLTLRFMLVAAILLPFHRLTRRQLPGMLLLAFTFGFVHFGLMVIGMQTADAGTTAVCIQMGTPLAMLLAAFWLKERLGYRQISGVAVAFIGVMILAGTPALTHWQGMMWLLISACGWACSTVIIKRLPPIAPLAMTGWLSLFAIPLVGISSLLTEQHQFTLLLQAGWRGWLGVIYSALGSSVFAYSLWYGLLKRYPASQILPWSLLSPALALLMGVAILHETLDHSKVLGTLLIVGGILLAVVRRQVFRRRVLA
ncbi:DMT family transporter [Pantoea sp. GM01]|uniref:DMT family transporter n=1 Tax=Pantoea sp. GM01 TaxID=1144320 RepID=UPI0002713B63|nr:putative membrane protein [Pantoea sp. GM01]